MSRARLTVSLLWKLAALALALCCVPADAAAQGGQAVTVRSIHVDGQSVQTVDGVRVTAPAERRRRSACWRQMTRWLQAR